MEQAVPDSNSSPLPCRAGSDVAAICVNRYPPRSKGFAQGSSRRCGVAVLDPADAQGEGEEAVFSWVRGATGRGGSCAGRLYAGDSRRAEGPVEGIHRTRLESLRGMSDRVSERNSRSNSDRSVRTPSPVNTCASKRSKCSRPARDRRPSGASAPRVRRRGQKSLGRPRCRVRAVSSVGCTGMSTAISVSEKVGPSAVVGRGP